MLVVMVVGVRVGVRVRVVVAVAAHARVCQLSMRLRSGPGTVDYCMSEQGCAAGAAPSPARVPEDPRFRWHTFPARPEPEFSDSASSRHDWQLPTARCPLPAAC